MGFFRNFVDAGRRAQGKILSEQGYALTEASRYHEALQFFVRALEIYRTLGDHRAEVDMLRMLGNTQEVLGDYQQAIRYGEQAIEIARSNSDIEGESMAQGLIGNCYLALGNYAQALDHFEHRLAIARQRGDSRGEGITLMNISSMYQGQSDYQTALHYLMQALAIIRTLPDRAGEGVALDNLGRLHFQLGDYTQAQEYLEQSLAITQKGRNRRDIGNVLEDLGNVSFALGDYKQAFAYQEQALAIMREIGDKRGEIMVLNGLGNISRVKGNYLQTIRYRQQQLTLARSIGLLPIEAMALGNLGTVFLSLGEVERAESYQKQQLEIVQRIKDRHQEAICLYNLANTYLLMRRYDESREYNQGYMKLVQEMGDQQAEITAIINLANLAFAQHDYAKALENLQQDLSMARKLKDRAMEGFISNSIGSTYFAQGDYKQAMIFHQQALEIARQIDRPPYEGEALHNLGLTLFQENELLEAEKALTAAMQVWEKLRTELAEEDMYRVSLFEQQTKTYSLLQQVLVARDKIEQALEIAERGRAQAFAELLVRNLAPQAAYAQLARIDIAHMKLIAQEQHATILEYSLISTDSKDQIARRYPGGEVFMWVINPLGEVHFRRTDLKPLIQLFQIAPVDAIAKLRENIGARGRDTKFKNHHSRTDQQASQQELQFLYELLINPVADLLPADPTEHLILIPQIFLFLLPFAALQDRSGQALIEQHTLRLAPSLQVLTLTQQRRQVSSLVYTDALIVGNPTMPDLINPDQTKQPLRSLPGAEEEAQAIADLLHVVPMIGDQATEEAVLARMKTASLIHLATHGLLDEEQRTTLPGAIALAPSGEHDGWLTSDDILTLKLRAGLVVLSACDTAQGRVTDDGIIGLSRSFIAAGVPSIIVSLWSVPDIPTAFFMATFYQALQQRLDKAQALRHAMLATKQLYPDPLVWAAFVLLGEA